MGGDECSTYDSSGKELCRYILGKLVEGQGGGAGILICLFVFSESTCSGAKIINTRSPLSKAFM
jgi:hypothetical protein